jgi:hypothetical protein
MKGDAMGEPWKTRPFTSSMEIAMARHAVLCAVEQAHPGLLAAIVEEAAATAQTKYGIEKRRALTVVASAVEAVTGALPSLAKYFTPFRKGRP